MSDLIERARVARREGRLTEARRDLTSAVDVARDGRSISSLGQALCALGQIERDLGHTERARALYAEALDGLQKGAEPLAIAHAARHLGEVYRESGALEEAEEHLTEAFVIHRAGASHRPLELANTLRPLALLREAQGRSGEARRLWEEARALYAAEGVASGVEECSRRLGALPESL